MFVKHMYGCPNLFGPVYFLPNVNREEIKIIPCMTFKFGKPPRANFWKTKNPYLSRAET